MDKYQQSVCEESAGLLHDYRLLYETSVGIVEECKQCGSRQFFRHNVPNEYYLQFHIRSALQRYDTLFPFNYPNL